MEQTIYEKIEQADLVLVGLGEEFQTYRYLRSQPEFAGLEKQIGSSPEAWMLPALNESAGKEKNQEIYESLCRLAELLKNKNYFVISVAAGEVIERVPWREGRLVMPCGSSTVKQCARGCEQVLLPVSREEKGTIYAYLEKIRKQLQKEPPLEEMPKEEWLQRETNQEAALKWTENIGFCPQCGGPLVLNNIFAGQYNENGYLPRWQLYTKWLQGTLNKKLLILELGVGMQFPSVIRWPFEKIAFFQQKAEFYRVNETLYQMTEELKGKGTSIKKNAIDWLKVL